MTTSCTKVSYADKKEAELRADQIALSAWHHLMMDKRMEVYWCERCEAWHIGTKERRHRMYGRTVQPLHFYKHMKSPVPYVTHSGRIRCTTPVQQTMPREEKE